MDWNKDEALKSLKIAMDALDGGDKGRALKFVLKARRLDPSLPVDELLARMEGDQGEKEPKLDSDQSTVHQRAEVKGLAGGGLGKKGGAASSSSVSAGKDYSAEQVLIVTKIRKKKDYYEILGVEKECSFEDVRKAYRKLSLKVHPDKNKAPGAEEAFKLVSKAFQCLSDEESKRKYDVSGSDEPVYDRRPTRHAANGFNGFYDGEVDAEEIFRNFFFGGFTQQTQFSGCQFGTGMRHRTPAANGSPGGSGFRTLIQLLPVILILLLNFLPSNDPVYSLHQTHPYVHNFATQKGVPFYVKSPNFEHKYPTSTQERLSLESKIERDFFNVVGQNCRVEMQRMHWGLAEKAPHCDMLKQFESVV